MHAHPPSTDPSIRTPRYPTGQLIARRLEIGTRRRCLTAGHQAFLAPAHLRCGDTYAQLAAGLGIGIVTVVRHVREAAEVLAALAPTLTEAMKTPIPSGV
ncbi:transposase family protein [Streptomyces sp. NPDC058107]|uniref:transposase family protein n=1 Tax=Streptomyces sp. NPDC058107 TaxID=3346343 RepID=UPI0036E19B61